MLARHLLKASRGSGSFTIPEPPPPDPPQPFTMTNPPEGGLTAQSHVQAFYVPAIDKTVVGYISGAGHIRALEYNHATETSVIQTIRGTWEADDHDVPGMLIRASDNKYLAAYSKHNSSDFRRRISSNALDASVWGSEALLDGSLGGTRYTYPRVHQLTDVSGDPVHMFYRDEPTAGDDSRWCRSISTNEGSTWGAQQVIFRQFSERAYISTVSDGRWIHIAAWNGKLDASTRTGHFKYDGLNNTFHLSDGTTLGALHYDIDDTTTIIEGIRAFPLYIHLDGDGHPIVVLGVTLGTGEFRYYISRWTGSEWFYTDIASGGFGYPYSSPSAKASYGCALDDGDLDTFYTLEEVATAKSELFRYTTTDGWETFSAPTQLTTGSNILQTRLTPVRNRSDVPVVWTYGTLSHYKTWSMGIKGLRV